MNIKRDKDDKLLLGLADCHTPKLQSFVKSYEKLKRPQAVAFRQLTGSHLSNSDRVTHLIHPYPAKLLMHIPNFFLGSSLVSNPSATILDPFCGSGTVLLEAIISGRNAIGCDTNPIARLIARVKTRPLDPHTLRQSINRLLRRIPDKATQGPPSVVNLDYWFYPHVIRQLTRLIQAINETRDVHIREFFEVCFSGCVRRVSLADPRLSVPVRLKLGQYPKDHWLQEKSDQHFRRLAHVNVLMVFRRILEDNFDRMTALSRLASSIKIGCATVAESDARGLCTPEHGIDMRIPNDSVDCIITSPPYAGAQKYIRASSLSLGWLGLASNGDLRRLDELTLGREFYPKNLYSEPLRVGIWSADKFLREIHRKNPLRSHIVGTYLVEMREAIVEMFRVTKEGGHLVLIVANNQVCGREFRATEWLTTIAEQTGFSLILKLVDSIRSRVLMTKRNKTASMITREWVLLFRKNYGHN
jgi:SAM-dependent methyltransferase